MAARPRAPAVAKVHINDSSFARRVGVELRVLVALASRHFLMKSTLGRNASGVKRPTLGEARAVRRRAAGRPR